MLKTSRVSEQAAEEGSVASLAISPLYRERINTAFDTSSLLDVTETAAFIQATQPKEWAKLSKQFPGGEQEALAAQLSILLQKRGTLEVLAMEYHSTASIYSLPTSAPLPEVKHFFRIEKGSSTFLHRKPQSIRMTTRRSSATIQRHGKNTDY